MVKRHNQQPMQLIGVQFDIAWEDWRANGLKVERLLNDVRPPAGSLVALPEMFSCGFSMNVRKIVDEERGAAGAALAGWAARFGCCIVGGQATLGADGYGRNEALAVDNMRGVLARYQKIHPYSPGKEAEHFRAGNEVVTFRAGAFTVAPFVCYDLRFPEIFRIAARRGAQLFVVIANWPTPRVEHWVTLLRARAIENQAYVLGVNRCGNDPYLAYPGRSLIVDFRGNVLADAGDREGVITADIDPAAQAAYRKELPFLDDMRGDLVPR